jgi:hypothetical protein
MKVIVTAASLLIMPGVVLRLTAEDAQLRKNCMKPLGDGLYKATLENHFKSGQVVDFPTDEIPKQYANSVSLCDEQGKVFASGGAISPPTFPEPDTATIQAPAKDADVGPQPLSKAERADLDSMTKAELLDLAEAHGITVESGWNKTQITTALKKQKLAA